MSTKRTVACLEFPVMERTYPLASGYLVACANERPEVRDAFDFSFHSFTVSRRDIRKQVREIEADVFTFSCYVWNMGLVRQLLADLFERKPDAHVILGGPQVMEQGRRYLDPLRENMVVCNGEGELTFAEYLTELAKPEPQLALVKGLSFFRGSQLITVPPQPRLRDLDAVPSPYIAGYFDPDAYSMAIIETNRGCPFRCTYCFWGAATNAKVYKKTLDRVRSEISWLAKNRCLYLHIADANFGMLKTDVEIVEHIIEVQKATGYPQEVYFSSSKNTPERVSQVVSMLNGAGLVPTQPISMQTMSAATLTSVKRDNIHESTYSELQKHLNSQKIASHLEMIWPLPGETLQSFKKGIEQLCALEADSIMFYPLMLLNNTEMNQQREQYQFVTVEDDDPNSECEIVVGTRDVSAAEYREGIRFGFHVTSLHSARCLRFVAAHLHRTGAMPFAELVTAFARHSEANGGSLYNRYIEGILSRNNQGVHSALGGLLHFTLHLARQEFDRMLETFLQSLPGWSDERVRFLFDLDLLNRPYVYLNTRIAAPRGLQLVQMLEEMPGGFRLALPDRYMDWACDLLGLNASEARSPSLVVQYHTSQYPYMKGKSLEQNFLYCNDKLHKMNSVLPVWKTERAGLRENARLAVC